MKSKKSKAVDTGRGGWYRHNKQTCKCAVCRQCRGELPSTWDHHDHANCPCTVCRARRNKGKPGSVKWDNQNLVLPNALPSLQKGTAGREGGYSWMSSYGIPYQSEDLSKETRRQALNKVGLASHNKGVPTKSFTSLFENNPSEFCKQPLPYPSFEKESVGPQGRFSWMSSHGMPYQSEDLLKETWKPAPDRVSLAFHDKGLQTENLTSFFANIPSELFGQPNSYPPQVNRLSTHFSWSSAEVVPSVSGPVSAPRIQKGILDPWQVHQLRSEQTLNSIDPLSAGFTYFSGQLPPQQEMIHTGSTNIPSFAGIANPDSTCASNSNARNLEVWQAGDYLTPRQSWDPTTISHDPNVPWFQRPGASCEEVARSSTMLQNSGLLRLETRELNNPSWAYSFEQGIIDPTLQRNTPIPNCKVDSMDVAGLDVGHQPDSILGVNTSSPMLAHLNLGATSDTFSRGKSDAPCLSVGNSNSPSCTFSHWPTSITQFPFGLEVQAPPELDYDQPYPGSSDLIHTQGIRDKCDERDTACSSPPQVTVLRKDNPCQKYGLMGTSFGEISTSSSINFQGGQKKPALCDEVGAQEQVETQSKSAKQLKRKNAAGRQFSKHVGNLRRCYCAEQQKRTKRKRRSPSPKWQRLLHLKKGFIMVTRKIYIRTRVSIKQPFPSMLELSETIPSNEADGERAEICTLSTHEKYADCRKEETKVAVVHSEPLSRESAHVHVKAASSELISIARDVMTEFCDGGLHGDEGFTSFRSKGWLVTYPKSEVKNFRTVQKFGKLITDRILQLQDSDTLSTTQTFSAVVTFKLHTLGQAANGGFISFTMPTRLPKVFSKFIVCQSAANCFIGTQNCRLTVFVEDLLSYQPFKYLMKTHMLSKTSIPTSLCACDGTGQIGTEKDQKLEDEARLKEDVQVYVDTVQMVKLHADEAQELLQVQDGARLKESIQVNVDSLQPMNAHANGAHRLLQAQVGTERLHSPSGEYARLAAASFLQISSADSFQELLKSVQVSRGTSLLVSNCSNRTDSTQASSSLASIQNPDDVELESVIDDNSENSAVPIVNLWDNAPCISVFEPQTAQKECPKGGLREKDKTGDENLLAVTHPLKGRKVKVKKGYVSAVTHFLKDAFKSKDRDVPIVEHVQEEADIEADFEVLPSTVAKLPKVQTGEYQRKLQILLDQPFELQELQDLEDHAGRRKPLLQLRETRQRSLDVATNRDGMSYLDHHPDLAKDLADGAPEHKLRLLRGFFFWLQHFCMPGSFKPWVEHGNVEENDDCVEVFHEEIILQHVHEETCRVNDNAGDRTVGRMTLRPRKKQKTYVESLMAKTNVAKAQVAELRTERLKVANTTVKRENSD